MTMMTSSSTMNLMNLPVEMIDKILSYLTYDQIAKARAVNRTFNMICSDKLNKGFILVNQFHSRCLKAVKSKLPRRESERRHHPLARHSDILMAVETRLSMLSMTFSKYVEAHQCCFIPGKVLDEALKVLRIVNNCSTPLPLTGQYPFLPRPHDFLQEYRDVSSMAMEHFDDKILPGIREKMRLENPRLYCFKSRPTETGRPRIIVPSLIKGAPQKVFVSVPSTSVETGNPVNNKSGQANALSALSALRMYRAIRYTKAKCNATQKSVDSLNVHLQFFARKIKVQNALLRRQMYQQRGMIKHLRRELRETRAAMNVMSKDLNQLKTEPSTSRGTKRKRDSSCEENCET